MGLIYLFKSAGSVVNFTMNAVFIVLLGIIGCTVGGYHGYHGGYHAGYHGYHGYHPGYHGHYAGYHHHAHDPKVEKEPVPEEKPEPEAEEALEESPAYEPKEEVEAI